MSALMEVFTTVSAGLIVFLFIVCGLGDATGITEAIGRWLSKRDAEREAARTRTGE